MARSVLECIQTADMNFLHHSLSPSKAAFLKLLQARSTRKWDDPWRSTLFVFFLQIDRTCVCPPFFLPSALSRTFTAGEAGTKTGAPVVYFPVVKGAPSLNSLTDTVSQGLRQTYAQFNPVFVDYASMDDVAAYEHQNAKDMLKNRTLKDYTPQLGFELDALGTSTSNGVSSLDLGFTIAIANNDSIPFMMSALNGLTQNVDATSGNNGANAGLGLRFLPTLKTFGAQGSENSDIPSFIVPAFLTYGRLQTSCLETRICHLPTFAKSDIVQLRLYP